MTRGVVDAGDVDVVCGIGTGPQDAVGAFPPGLTWYDGEHPFPGTASERAGRASLAIARRAADEGLPLLVLLSGGASAMLAAPAAGLTLDEKATATRALMRAGVAIDGLNVVRKHLSAVKGGRLAAAARDSLTLAISDVHGPIEDDPATIGSGPTVADPSTFRQALEVIARAGAGDRMPASVIAHLRRGRDETPKPGDARLARSQFRLLGNRHTAMAAAADAARALGCTTHVLSAATRGEAREAGEAFAREALATAARSAGPCCVIASGETTVQVRGDGRGGRNQEFALGAARVLAEPVRAAVIASAGTDGIDGPTDAAGAFADSTTLARARDTGLDPDAALRDNDTYGLFLALGDLIVWGQTGTNVGDLHVMLTAG